MQNNKSSVPRYHSVQALRGLAALMVVMFHIFKMGEVKLGGTAIEFASGAGGVDIFFAISGFVMVLTTAHTWQKRGSWQPFLRRRVIRIAPLYWMMTAAMAGMLLLDPHLAMKVTLMPWHTAASFLFIPAWNSNHEPFPLLIAGWTLPFEMLFYALFAGALALRIKPVGALSLLLVGLAGLSYFRTSDWGAPASLIDPLLLEFVFGMWIGVATLKDIRIPFRMAAWLAPLMLALLLASNTLPAQFCFDYRVIVWGVPGALLLASAIALEERARVYLTGLPDLLGDASYAIYLSHSFVISFVALVFTRMAWSGNYALLAAFLLCLPLSAAIGIIIHRHVEKPLLAWLNHRPEKLALAYAQ